jgi:hypothetical protein
MHQAITVFKAALAVSVVAVAACGGAGSSSTSPSPSALSPVATINEAANSGTSVSATSVSGTTIPSATQIKDSADNVWTVAAGVVYENGAKAGYSSAVSLLLYDNGTIYQENSTGGWWAWRSGAWVSSSDPRAQHSANGATIPTVSQITDDSGNIWTLSGRVVYENGAVAGSSYDVAHLVLDNGVIYRESWAGGWWSWTAGKWERSGAPATTGSAALAWSAPTENTNGTALTDLAGYKIYYGSSAESMTQTVQVASPTATAYVVSNLAAGTYYFAVAAYASDGTQSTQSAATAKTVL